LARRPAASRGGIPRLGVELRRARIDAGFTQAEIAERVGLATEAYGRIERSAAIPRTDTLMRLALALETSTDRLLGLQRGGGSNLHAAEPTASADPEVNRLLRLARRMPRRSRSALVRLLATLEHDRDDKA